jgi:hypothetical protein
VTVTPIRPTVFARGRVRSVETQEVTA